MRDWAGPLGSCVLYLSCPTDPSLSAGPGVVPFARLFAFLPSRRPPHSVRGHGLGNRAAKQRHGTIGVSCSLFFVVLPTPSSAPSRGAARVSDYSHSGTGLYVLSSFLVMHVVLFSLCYAFSARHFPPTRDCGLYHLSIPCWFSTFVSPPPRSVLGPGWSLFARLFAFLLPSRRSPHSVLGHGLGNRAAKLRHGTVEFSSSFFFVVLPTPSSAPSLSLIHI